MEERNITKFHIPQWKTKRQSFAALLAAVSVVVSTFSAVSVSFSTTAVSVVSDDIEDW
jgi:hypothetical protein